MAELGTEIVISAVAFRTVVARNGGFNGNPVANGVAGDGLTQGDYLPCQFMSGRPGETMGCYAGMITVQIRSADACDLNLD